MSTIIFRSAGPEIERARPSRLKTILRIGRLSYVYHGAEGLRRARKDGEALALIYNTELNIKPRGVTA